MKSTIDVTYFVKHEIIAYRRVRLKHEGHYDFGIETHAVPYRMSQLI